MTLLPSAGLHQFCHSGILSRRWWINLDHLRQSPSPCDPIPAIGMPLSCLVGECRPVPTDRTGLAAVALGGGNEPDAAETMEVVVPDHQSRHLQVALVLAGKGSPSVIVAVFHPPAQSFRNGVLIADSLPGEGSENPSASRRLLRVVHEAWSGRKMNQIGLQVRSSPEKEDASNSSALSI
jgi:hypothetical protein